MLKKITKKHRFKWSSEAMQLAISDIRRGKLSKKKAALYAPKTTLCAQNNIIAAFKK